MELTSDEIFIIDNLKKRGFDLDCVCGFILTLENEKNRRLFAEWLKKNNSASRDEVFDACDRIMDSE